MARPTKVNPNSIKRTLGFLIHRSQRLMNQQLEAVFHRFGLTVLQFVTLELVREGHASVPSDIAKTLGLDTGGATRLVDQLEEKGLLERRREAKDRRLVTIALTPEGVELARAAEAASTEYLNGLLDVFASEDRQAFLDHLTTLVRRLEDGSS
jgi:DNA-binding MarR family transcriptional regulator